MQSLFEQIEMPLLFTLYDMEKVGILVEKEALHEYGAKLGERISELEADIYERAGESFNINSPKQLGVILFEKCICLMERKQKQDIPLQQKFLKNSVLRIRLWR